VSSAAAFRDFGLCPLFAAASDSGYSIALRILLNEFSMAQFWSQVGAVHQTARGRLRSITPTSRAPGGVVEWLMAPVLKTGRAQALVGSNPTPSAVFKK
jgi:hypothetical protein